MRGRSQKANLIWDTGSTLSFILNRLAIKLKLKGKDISLAMLTIGQKITYIKSILYKIQLEDQQGKLVEFEVIGIDKISSPIVQANIKDLAKILQVDPASINRPSSGELEVLIGLQYSAFHPDRVKSVGHLTLYQNRFGKVIGGSHPSIREVTKIEDACSLIRFATVMHVSEVHDDTFFQVESLGVSCTPKCGSCKCGTCHPGGKPMSLKEESEYNMIERNLRFDIEKGRWFVNYPWIRDPAELKNNRKVAMAILQSTERRLMRQSDQMILYGQQVDDMLNRKVAREVTEEELSNYRGPQFYLAHHAVLKPESKTTPCRIVFNSSAKFMGLSLNDCLAKGPSLLNTLLGILVRFRENRIAFIGDISKMYHSIDIPLRDQMTHLFLWRKCDSSVEPTVYAMTALNMGDKPSATIAQVALRKSAESAQDAYPESANIILKNAYMDDIPASVKTDKEAIQYMSEIDEILKQKGFRIKKWFHNCNVPTTNEETLYSLQTVNETKMDTSAEGVLGMMWDMAHDILYFKSKDTVRRDKHCTKRNVLSVTNSIFDPLGLLTPFTTRAKMIMRHVWAYEPRIDWDGSLPPEIERDWKQMLIQLEELSNISFSRATCPTVSLNLGSPILVIFSDASMQSYGAVAYLRWECGGTFVSRLVMAKSRTAPLKTIDIVRLELCGAVLSSRIRLTIQREMTQKVSKVIHLTDSEIVHAMVHRQSYGFNTFVANRVGEIQQHSLSNEWAWVSGSPLENVADIITRGSSPNELAAESMWQNGPAFLSLPESQWPVRYEVNKEVKVPESELKRTQPPNLVAFVIETDSVADRIDCSRFSRWDKLIGVTAMVLYACKRFRRPTGADHGPTVVNRQEAKQFWIKHAQKDLQLASCKKLRPILEDGVYTVGGRTERWMGCTWNQQQFVLLPTSHHVSWLIALDMHTKGGHLGIASSMSKVRSRYWIIGLRILMKKIINHCRKCKDRLKRTQEQIMSPLPLERIKPSNAFRNVGIDYFGPFQTKGEVQKRTRGKSFGVIITCFVARAVYVDIANDCSTDGFLQVFRRFCSFRGWPAKIFSDKGTQLVSASNELKSIVSQLDWKEIKAYGYIHQAEWSFAPADAQWYNGATEALVKTVKRALSAAVGGAVMKFSELQTVMFESAELVNSRPIGHHPGSPDDGVYLSPNDLLLGRSTSRVPQGPFKERCSDKHRFDFVQSVTSNFWKRWMQEVFPTLVTQPKWHTEQRDLKVGDVVLVQDANLVRGQWKMAIVEEAILSRDNRVRRVIIAYNTDEGTRKQAERAVQRLILLVPSPDS